MELHVKRFNGKVDTTIEVSDTIGFDKKTFDGWYIQLSDIGEDGILRKWWHHYAHDYNSKQLAKFDIKDCRVITKADFLDIK